MKQKVSEVKEIGLQNVSYRNGGASIMSAVANGEGLEIVHTMNGRAVQQAESRRVLLPPKLLAGYSFGCNTNGLHIEGPMSEK